MNMAFLSSFNGLDIVLLIIMIILVVRGVWTGFSRAIATLAGALAGFWAGISYYPLIAVRFSSLIDSGIVRSLLAFFVIFIFIYLLFTVVGILVRGFFNIIKIGWIDRVLGGVVGFAKGAVISGVLLFLMTMLLPDNAPLLRQSVLYPSFSRMARTLSGMAPENIKGKFMWKWRRLELER